MAIRERIEDTLAGSVSFIDRGLSYEELSAVATLQLRRAYGAESPVEQMAAATIIGWAAILSSAVTLGATLLIAFWALIWFIFGVLRAVSDSFNEAWPFNEGM